MLQLRTDALKRSLTQCSCVHDRMAPNHPAYDCALDAPGANGGYEDALINKPPKGERMWGVPQAQASASGTSLVCGLHDACSAVWRAPLAGLPAGPVAVGT